MIPIKVYFNYKVVDGPWGGANCFLRELGKAFGTMPEIQVVSEESEDYDIFFLNQLYRGPGRTKWTPRCISVAEIIRLKKYGSRSLLRSVMNRWFADRGENRRGKKIVCRVVDLTEHAYGFKSGTDRHLMAALRHTDFDVFQSRYIYKVFRQAGYDKKQFSVIHNGVNQRIFNMQGKVWWNGQEDLNVFSCTFATRKSKRFDIIARLSEEKGIESYHIGSWREDVDPKKVKRLGKMTQEEFSALYRRQGHVFLHPAERDICPNAVVEALSCGLPVIFNPWGGTQEIVGDCGVALEHDPSVVLDKVKEDYWGYIERIKENWHRYSIEFAAAQYLEVFRRVLWD